MRKVYHELGVETLKLRIWLKKLRHFYNILTEKCAFYLFDLNTLNRAHNTKHSNNASVIDVRHGYFKNSFFPLTISGWNKA